MNDLVTLITSSVEFHIPTLGAIIALILICLLLYISGFASGSEIAFFSLSPNDIDELEPTKSSIDKNIQILRDDSERTLATILILNNLVNVTIVMLSGFVLREIVVFKVAWIEIFCATILLTFLLLLFGEIMPKVYSSMNPLKFCRHAVNGIMIARKLFWPIESILMRSSVFAEKMLKKEKRKLSMDEIEQALELTNKNEISNEQEMLEGIIRFVDETAKEVMTSRRDIVDLDIRSNYSEVLKCIVENNYSRIPVYQDNEDNIRGILYIKDLLPYLNKPTNFRWQSLIRPPYFVPETKKIDDLLREFQENKVHIAIVVDEFGGTSGLVTLEDILEEIVGEINDEFDDDKSFYHNLSTGIYLFEGKTSIGDFTKVLDLDDDTFEELQGDADSMAGLLLELKGEFPVLHEKLSYKQFLFEVMAIENLRISKIKVTILDEKQH
ncbi:gliding motility-associated protein GldE [Prevotella aurantiaca JCM 15754]|jgi:gliding motility-associated protein gldE|uniref:Gliding motility-associated protein GldE n=1 Tax=Prevotella aurantiaca TaxID=596085 RepID=A0A930HMC8_9BACT|nr:gliding motility-associated protein GldE [Prevotella aurantiaca]MBF1384465.1 gliding motility-associated protein GldE [Prevotella aurantiaca]